MLHAWEKFGLEAAELEFYTRYDRRGRHPHAVAPPFEKVVRGKIDFLKMVRGDTDATYIAMRNRFHALAPDLIAPLEQPLPLGVTASRRLFHQTRNMVFHLAVRKGEDWFRGTAFAWKPDTLVTAAHNILADEVVVWPPWPSDQPLRHDEIVRHNLADGPRGVDLAAIHLIGGAAPARSRIKLRATPIQVGEEIAALGYPNISRREASLAIRTGIIESVAPHYGGEVGSIQVSAQLVGGMSGGPVVDSEGHLVGVISERTSNRPPTVSRPQLFIKWCPWST